MTERMLTDITKLIIDFHLMIIDWWVSVHPKGSPLIKKIVNKTSI